MPSIPPRTRPIPNLLSPRKQPRNIFLPLRLQLRAQHIWNIGYDPVIPLLDDPAKVHAPVVAVRAGITRAVVVQVVDLIVHSDVLWKRVIGRIEGGEIRGPGLNEVAVLETDFLSAIHVFLLAWTSPTAQSIAAHLQDAIALQRRIRPRRLVAQHVIHKTLQRPVLRPTFNLRTNSVIRGPKRLETRQRIELALVSRLVDGDMR